MKFLNLFRRSWPPAKVANPTPLAPTRVWEEPRHDLAGRGSLSEFRDVHGAWRFCATMQLRTPLRVLARHGEVHSNRATAPPTIADEPWQGIWVPVSKTFRELGLDIDEPAPGTMASHIGPIPADGGSFLSFLKSVRAVVESDGAAVERRKRLHHSLADPAVASMVRKLGGRAAILDRLFPSFLSTIPGLPAKALAGLKARRLTSAKAISSASDTELLAIPGIGQTKLVVLRARSEDAGKSPEIYLDS